MQGYVVSHKSCVPALVQPSSHEEPRSVGRPYLVEHAQGAAQEDDGSRQRSPRTIEDLWHSHAHDCEARQFRRCCATIDRDG